VDQNCDGADGVDADGDRHASLASGGDDCEDASASIHPGQPDESWTIEPIESDGDTGHGIRLALEADGTVNAAYSDWTAREIRLARRSQGQWNASTVLMDAVGALDLGVDSADDLRMCYQDIDAGWSHSWLRCGGDSAGTFDFTLVDGSGWTAIDPSLVIDEADFAFVSYATVEGQGHQLRSASDSSGAWSSEPVDADGGLHSTLAVDGLGALHVAFTASDGSIRYATNDGGAWATEIVDAAAGHEGPWLAIDGDGEIHVAYRRDGHQVWHATRSAGAWPSEPVWEAPGANAPGRVSGGIAASGVVVIFFPQPGDGTAALGTASNLGGTWLAEPVDDSAAATASDAVVQGQLVYAVYQGGLGADTDARFALRGVPDGVDDDCSGLAW